VHPTRENSGYAYEKRAPAVRWYGAPRMVNPTLSKRNRTTKKLLPGVYCSEVGMRREASRISSTKGVHYLFINVPHYVVPILVPHLPTSFSGPHFYRLHPRLLHISSSRKTSAQPHKTRSSISKGCCRRSFRFGG